MTITWEGAKRTPLITRPAPTCQERPDDQRQPIRTEVFDISKQRKTSRLPYLEHDRFSFPLLRLEPVFVDARVKDLAVNSAVIVYLDLNIAELI